MKIIVGIFGLVCGFLLGQLILSRMLRDFDREEILELMKDKGKRFKYGLLNWGLAALGAYSFVWFYEQYARDWLANM